MWNLSHKPENAEKWLNSGTVFTNRKNDERLDIVLDPNNLPPAGPDGKIRITGFPKKNEPRPNAPRQPDPQAYQQQRRSALHDDEVPF